MSSINSSNVSKLGVAWKVPITGKAGTFGNFATTRSSSMASSTSRTWTRACTRSRCSTGKLLWHTQIHSPNDGPDGVSVVGGKVYGETLDKAFALSAATGEQLWSQKIIRNGGEGIDMAPADQRRHRLHLDRAG